MSLPTRVVNGNTEPYDVWGARPSALGNQFKEGIDGTREQVIAKYRHWFMSAVLDNKSFRDYVLTLKGKTLGCHCKPKACHLDVVADWLNLQP